MCDWMCCINVSLNVYSMCCIHRCSSAGKSVRCDSFILMTQTLRAIISMTHIYNIVRQMTCVVCLDRWYERVRTQFIWNNDTCIQHNTLRDTFIQCSQSHEAMIHIYNTTHWEAHLYDTFDTFNHMKQWHTYTTLSITWNKTRVYNTLFQGVL